VWVADTHSTSEQCWMKSAIKCEAHYTSTVYPTPVELSPRCCSPSLEGACISVVDFLVICCFSAGEKKQRKRRFAVASNDSVPSTTVLGGLAW